jgi:hypothetical protein
MPLDNNDLTCSDRCLTEFHNRREIAHAKIRATRALKRQHRRTREEIMSSMMRALARVLLERGVPVHTSCRDLDQCICEIEPALKDMNPNFRKSLITRNAGAICYRPYSHAGKGRVTFILVDDKEIVRQKLQGMAM